MSHRVVHPEAQERQEFVESLVRQLGVDAAALYLVVPQGLREAARHPRDNGFPGEVARLALQRDSAVHVGLASADPGLGEALAREGLRAVTGLPLPRGRGVVAVGRRAPVPLDGPTLRLLQARAEEISVRLELQELRSRLEECEAELEARERGGTPTEAPPDPCVASLSRMARQLGHDLRGPLANLRVALDLLRGSDPEDQERLLDRLDAEIGHASSLIADRVHLTRALEPVMTATSLAAAARQAAMELRRPSDVRLELALDGAPTVRGDGELLARLLLLLAENAVEALTEGGVLRMAAVATPEGAELRVEDSGPGVPAELRERVLRPGFTTRERGSGLGLPICRRIAEAHGGTLRLEASPLGGLAAVVDLPSRQEIPAPREIDRAP